MLKIGIDNYCYHRLFELEGEEHWTIFDFIKRAKELEVDGVSLETCFFESLEPDYLKKVRQALDEANLDRVLAWGHPDGLEGGRNLSAAEELKKHFKTAELLNSRVMLHSYLPKSKYKEKFYENLPYSYCWLRQDGKYH